MFPKVKPKPPTATEHDIYQWAERQPRVKRNVVKKYRKRKAPIYRGKIG
jgi:hypothetical protein